MTKPMKIYPTHKKEYGTLPLRVLRDNFVHFILYRQQTILIDAGETAPILRFLKENQLQLKKILITHTHSDHVGGCRALQDQLGVQSTSPALAAGTTTLLETPCTAIATPGHVAIHKIYHFPELGILFTGDTLINGACGRLLGGTAEQLFESFQKIAALPDHTRILGGHDYLEENMRFAQSIEPHNAAIKARLSHYRTDPIEALFVTLAEEKSTNPFLRVGTATEFAQLRCQKDHFF